MMIQQWGDCGVPHFQSLEHVQNRRKEFIVPPALWETLPQDVLPHHSAVATGHLLQHLGCGCNVQALSFLVEKWRTLCLTLEKDFAPN